VAEPLYLPPNPAELLQGDIFTDFPSVYIDTRPIRVARHWKEIAGRDMWSVHAEESTPPKGGFKWTMSQGGESGVLVHAHLGMAMLMSHDCEIENDPNARILAMIRPIDHLDAKTQERLFSDNVEEEPIYTAFPLEAQMAQPKIDRSFVDFRRITTVRPAVLEASNRIASLSEDLRKAIAERFWLYLFRRLEAESPNR
jgi:hypothetical protein